MIVRLCANEKMSTFIDIHSYRYLLVNQHLRFPVSRGNKKREKYEQSVLLQSLFLNWLDQSCILDELVSQTMIKSRKMQLFWLLHKFSKQSCALHLHEMFLTCTGTAQMWTFFTRPYPLQWLSKTKLWWHKLRYSSGASMLDRPCKGPKTASFQLPRLFCPSARYSCLTSFLIYPWHHWCAARQKLVQCFIRHHWLVIPLFNWTLHTTLH